MSKTIAIAGIGWLGKSLAQQLETLGYRVKGSVTSLEKASVFQRSGLDTYEMEISENGVKGSVDALLSKTDYLVILIPPGLRRNTGSNYVKKMTLFLKEIEKSAVTKVIFASSTAVYDSNQGCVTERTTPNATHIAGRQLIEVEQLFLNAEKLTATVVRFGGLFGGSRQPVRYLAGRKELRNGKAPVNLIHRDDCIGILVEIIKQDAFGYTFNAVIPRHPSKKEYYTEKAKGLKLPLPHFSDKETNDNYKQVDSENLDSILAYNFIHYI